MPLIICPDCNKEYSDLAKACPNCARPTFATLNETFSPPDNRPFEPLVPPQKNNYGIGFFVYFAVLVLGVSTFVFTETASDWKYIAIILTLAGGAGLLITTAQVIFKLLQKV